MKRSDSRILTTHVGSLARPHELLDAMRARAEGSQDDSTIDRLVTTAVLDVVKRQAATAVVATRGRHPCYGLNHGPRLHDAPLADVVGLMLQINAGAYSFEVGNPRHQHEWRVWEDTKLPAGKIVIPGFLCHAHNFVEHPRLIADGIVTYARLVGRENVIASADCGFSSRAIYQPDVHPTVLWAKFRALSEGARIATEELWG